MASTITGAGGTGTAVVTTSTPVSPTTTGPDKKPKPKSYSVTHQATFIPTYTESAGATVLHLDYVLFLTGSAAQSAAAAHHETVENDYYIVNDNPLIRSFIVSSSCKIIMHPNDEAGASRQFSISEFKSLMDSGSATYSGKAYSWRKDMTFWVNVTNNQLTRIEEQWLP